MLRKKRFWIVAIVMLLAAYLYENLTHPRFGADPSGERLARIEKMPNYKDGAFHNTMPDPTNVEKPSFLSLMYQIHFDKEEGTRVPSQSIPSIKTDLKSLDLQENILIPLGHSSFYLQLHGLRILIDPVFAPYAAPFSFLNESFEGSNVYTVADMPMLDYILISHDHYDHLDYDAMKALQPLLKKSIICPMGVGAHLELWGYTPEQLLEGYWYESFSLGNAVKVQILPARHYSSRLFSKNKTLWAAFAISSPSEKIFFSGDTGYGDHILEIASKEGPFDTAIIDCGQFNDKGWPHIHMLPEDVAKSAAELGAKRLIPMHNGKFSIALHDWKAPLDMITEASKDKDYTLLTPIIGDKVNLDMEGQTFAPWWKKIQ